VVVPRTELGSRDVVYSNLSLMLVSYGGTPSWEGGSENIFFVLVDVDNSENSL
jgi:hypothetical protein